MKPCSRKAMPYKNSLQDVGFGSKNTVASIKGSTKKLGEKYRNCLIVLYNKVNLQPLAVRKPDENCEYQFLGLNTDLKTFIVAFDNSKQYNAVIQDNVVPK
ncbi:hypothetical protein A7P53_00100 [Acinetobacter defluvii]|uniref:hypothetical protein n=1 Tax=Acinetobacter defluvii TaxID=1871111 RepID=UPI0014906EAF|nr:hypothetical protein [Acinetobacter defluvii]NNP71294.1 hypothetical protein [Acinetobacter defluvii]